MIKIPLTQKEQADKLTSNGRGNGKLVHGRENGDRETADRLYKQYWEGLFKHAYHILGSVEAAEDVTQEAFTQTLRSLSAGKRVDEVEAWLHRCVHNAALSYIRKQRHRNHLPLEDESDSVQHENNILDKLEIQATTDDVFAAASKLPERQRTAFIMKYIYGMTSEQAAQELGTNTESFRQLIFRVRTKMRQAIGTVVPVKVLIPASHFYRKVKETALSIKYKVASHINAFTSQLANYATGAGQAVAVITVVALAAGATYTIDAVGDQIEKAASVISGDSSKDDGGSNQTQLATGSYAEAVFGQDGASVAPATSAPSGSANGDAEIARTGKDSSLFATIASAGQPGSSTSDIPGPLGLSPFSLGEGDSRGSIIDELRDRYNERERGDVIDRIRDRLQDREPRREHERERVIDNPSRPGGGERQPVFTQPGDDRDRQVQPIINPVNPLNPSDGTPSQPTDSTPPTSDSDRNRVVTPPRNTDSRRSGRR